MDIKAIILAGGKSSRMGTDKGLILFGDKQLVNFSIELSKKICNDIYISTSNNDYSLFGYPLISDIVPEIGPIGGLHAAMTNLQADSFFIISCDIPNASFSLAESMREKMNDFEIIVPVWENKIEPLFGFYSLNILPQVENQINKGNYKMIDLLSICNTYYYPIDAEVDGTVAFKNINFPDDVGI